MSMMPVTAALLISNRQLWEQAHSCIQNLPVRIALEQNDPSEMDELLDRIERHRSDVVLVEANLLPVPLEEFVRRLRDTASQPADFVFHLEASPQHILEALHAGAGEYLCPPLVEPLRKAFEKLSAERSRSPLSQPGALGRIFGFLSAKGGCGATTFACHTAAETARRLKAPVLLADFDFDAGLLRFVMKSKAAYSLRDALDNMHRMDASYWKALVSAHGHLDVIPAPEDLAAKRPGDAKETAHLMRFIRSLYQAAVVDFGRHVSRAALDSLPELDTLYVLTSPSPDDLEHARDCIADVTAREFPVSRIRVLVNRVPERGGPDPKAVADFLGTAPAAWFPADAAALYDAWSEGRLIEANSRLGREFGELAGSVAERVLGARSAPKTAGGPAAVKREAPARTAEARGLRRLFSFLRGAPAAEPSGSLKRTSA